MFTAHLSVTIKRFTRHKQKVVLAAMLEGKSMPFNMATNCWFSVSRHSKLDQNKNQNRSKDNVQDLGNGRRYIYKDPGQDSGQRNILFVLPKLIEICMETPC